MHLRVPFKNTKIHEDAQEREERIKNVAEDGKKAKFWGGPAEGGPAEGSLAEGGEGGPGEGGPAEGGRSGGGRSGEGGPADLGESGGGGGPNQTQWIKPHTLWFEGVFKPNPLWFKGVFKPNQPPFGFKCSKQQKRKKKRKERKNRRFETKPQWIQWWLSVENFVAVAQRPVHLVRVVDSDRSKPRDAPARRSVCCEHGSHRWKVLWRATFRRVRRRDSKHVPRLRWMWCRAVGSARGATMSDLIDRRRIFEEICEGRGGHQRRSVWFARGSTPPVLCP